MELLKTENSGNGFYGEMHQAGCADAAWDEAMTVVAEATGAEPDFVRAFLDSTWGRHFGATVRDFLDSRTVPQAVRAAAARWQGWKLPARTRRELDIPEPMPYLTGLVYSAAFDAEVA